MYQSLQTNEEYNLKIAISFLNLEARPILIFVFSCVYVGINTGRYYSYQGSMTGKSKESPDTKKK